MKNEENFILGDKSETLYFKIFDTTTNRKHYPIKHKRIADKLQDCSLTIYCAIIDANSIKPDSEMHKIKRFELQTAAITECNKMLSLLKYSLHATLISAATCEELTQATLDVKYMTLAWRK